jgi:hypothetical protein
MKSILNSIAASSLFAALATVTGGAQHAMLW